MVKRKRNGRKNFDMHKRVHKLARRMDYSPDESFMVFLDTGAIIDCEGEAKRWKLADSQASVRKIYDILSNYKNLVPLVTEDTLREVFKHHRHCIVNGNPEISKENFDIVQGFHNNYVNFLRGIRSIGVDVERAREDLLKAYDLAYEEGHKKKERDPLSEHDLSLLTSAVRARYSQFPHFELFGDRYSKVVGREPDRVIILSPDDHMHKTLEVLTDGRMSVVEQNGRFGYDGIKAVTSRETP